MRQFCGSKENYSPSVGALWKSMLWISGWGWGALLTLASSLLEVTEISVGSELLLLTWWYYSGISALQGEDADSTSLSGGAMAAVGAKASPLGMRCPVVPESTHSLGEAAPTHALSNKRAPNRPWCALCWASALIAIILPKTDHTFVLQRCTTAINCQKGSSP